jgi:conjugal transfer mating pair stabilization protein TraN
MNGFRIMGAALLSLSSAALLVAASPTTSARDDGQAFGTAQKPLAAARAKNAPNAEALPNFSAAPSASGYYTDPAALEAAAPAQAPSSPGYRAVTESLATRAQFSASEIKSTVTVGKAVAASPSTYTSGFSANGAASSCVPLPPTNMSPGRYEQSCNSGYIEQPGAGPVSCTVSLDHSFGTANRYECSESNAGFNGTDACDIFDGSSGGVCTITGFREGRCLVREAGRGGGCLEPGEPIRQMSCSSLVPGGTLLGTQTVYLGATLNDSACATPKGDPLCTASPDVCTDSTPQTRTINGVSVTQPCWAWERSYQCAGTLTPASDCGDLDALGCTFVREQCLTGETPCLTVDRVYSCPIPPVRQDKQHICDGDVYCLNGECDTIEREASADFKDAAVALNVMSQMGREFDPEALKLFDGDRLTCSKTIFGLTNCCVPRGFPLLGGCNAEDRALKDRRESGKCTYVGTYCDQKVLGICLRKKEAHCCFISKISRILQEQGRRQINKPFDDPKTEQCAGFTIEEFQRLDLSQMDFSEVYAEFTDAARVPAELDVASQMQTKINAYYASSPPT